MILRGGEYKTNFLIHQYNQVLILVDEGIKYNVKINRNRPPVRMFVKNEVFVKVIAKYPNVSATKLGLKLLDTQSKIQKTNEQIRELVMIPNKPNAAIPSDAHKPAFTLIAPSY